MLVQRVLPIRWSWSFFAIFQRCGRYSDRNRKPVRLEDQSGGCPINCRSWLRASYQAHGQLHAQLRYHEAAHALRLLLPVSRPAFRGHCFGAAEHDPVEMYKIELLTGARERPTDQTMAESYVRTALELRDMDERTFFDRFSGETSRVCSGFPAQKADDVACRVLDLHQRHGQAVGEVLTNAVKDHSAELVSGSVAPSSVLVMALVPGRGGVVARVGGRTDPLRTWLDRETKITTAEVPPGRYGAPRRRAKNRPTFERARGAVEEIYPEGVPSQSAEPNVNLCRRVGEKLKKSGLPNVSNDTILRAAGRRK